jgi:hypothetical protein
LLRAQARELPERRGAERIIILQDSLNGRVSFAQL